MKMKRAGKWCFFIFALCVSGLCACWGGRHVQVSEAAKKKNIAKPNLTVALKQVSLENERLERDGSGRMKYVASIRNHSTKGTIRKIEYTFTAMVKKEAAAVETGEVSQGLRQTEVTLVAAKIKPGKASEPVSCDGDESGQLSHMKLKTIRLYAGTALYIYDAEKQKGTVRWGIKDTKAPVISGWVGKKSFCGGEPYLICYSDWKNSFDFAKYVSAVDDRDGNVEIRVDTSQINWAKNGSYKVIYRAVDRAGNKATAWAKVQVIVSGTAEHIADQVLRSVVKKNWTDEKKARAIYRYIRGHCAYVGTAPHTDWRGVAVKGLRYHSGDCYTYYAITRLLLSRAGIPNITVTRYPIYGGRRHWWNMAYVRGGWYHFDTTPRLRKKADFCLLTDAQMRSYSSGNTFQFRQSMYPARAVKKISSNP